jgi:hypothetical protein
MRAFLAGDGDALSVPELAALGEALALDGSLLPGNPRRDGVCED